MSKQPDPHSPLPGSPFTYGVPDVSLLEDLRTAALEARGQHYAPYSGFEVLAAVQTTDGRIYGGSNVENANYTLTVHAEQNAIMAALADGALERCGRAFIKAIYVRCASEGAPCGGCRQAINEFATPDCLWIGDDARDGTVISGPFSALLPLDFGPGIWAAERDAAWSRGPRVRGCG